MSPRQSHSEVVQAEWSVSDDGNYGEVGGCHRGYHDYRVANGGGVGRSACLGACPVCVYVCVCVSVHVCACL